MSEPDGQPAADRSPREPRGDAPIDCRVVVLTHYLPPYIARVHYHAAPRVRDLKILLSIDQEPNRQFGNTWDGLDVRVQKSVMLRRPWKHRAGFQDELYVHFPYDTIGQLRRANPDIVLSYELGFRSLASALYCRLYRKRLALCVCVSEHTERGRGPARHLLRRCLLRAADAVTFNGPSCRRYLERFGVPASKLFHLPYSVSDLVRYRGRVERGADANHRLVYIGQLNERKGVLPMVEAISGYCRSRPDRTIELDLIGSGHLEQALRELDLPSNLRLSLQGYIANDQLGDVLGRYGVLIFPTLADEWGLVVNEALQAGMPVLGSEYAQACTTLIQEGENGWLYRPDAPRQLHQKLDAMLATPHSRMLQMRQAAQKSVASITPENVADQLAEMYRFLST